MMFEPRTRDEVAEKVAKYSAALVLNGDGDFWQLAVERASDPGRVIGDIYFAIKDAANASAEIGWTLHPDHTGSGYMTEAAGAMLAIAYLSRGPCQAGVGSVVRARGWGSGCVRGRPGLLRHSTRVGSGSAA
jgi:RimJ/RimL family protein N-acetyltransferase